METTSKQLKNARGTFAPKPIRGPKMDRDHVLSMLLEIPCIFRLLMETFGTVPKPIVKVFVCSLHFRFHFVLKSRMKPNSKWFAGPCEL